MPAKPTSAIRAPRGRRRSRAVFAERLRHSWRWSIPPRLLVLVAFVAGGLVFADARKRMRADAAAAWAIGTIAALGLSLPLYLIVRPSKRTAWGLTEIAGVTLFFAGTLPLAGRLLLPHARAGALPPFGIIVVLAVVQNALFVAAALYLAAVKYGLPLASLGLRLDHARRRGIQGLVAAAAAVGGNGLGQNLTVFLLGLRLGQPEAEKFVTDEQSRTPIYRLLPRMHTPVDVAVLALVVGVIVPLGEEIFFRGLTLGALRRAMNRHVAVAISALFFAAAHLQPVELLPILILGLVLGYLYDLTGSLVPGMIAHGLNNLAALFLFYQAPTIGS